MFGFRRKRRKRNRWRKGNTVTLPLIALEDGEKGIVASLNTKHNEKIKKLMAIGILPGTQLQLIRSFPAYVLRVDNTQVAVDKDIASEIYVTPLDDSK